MPPKNNPFPGMNPFFELRWPDVHLTLIGYIREALSIELPSDLSVRAEEHIGVSGPEGDSTYRSDVAIREGWQNGFPPLWQPEAEGAAAIAVADPEIVLASPVIERWLEIRDRDGRLITAIEVLSPRNKEGNGRVSYLEKQVDYISCGVNLVEIDLVRAGLPTVAAARAMVGEVQGTESIICVTRASRSDRHEVYRTPLREPLPAFRVPLRECDPDVPLALQPLIDRCYRTGRYWQISQPFALRNTLWVDEIEWVEQQLASAGGE